MRSLVLILTLAATASGQIIGYETFEGLSTSGGIRGSGSGSIGWADSGWQEGSDSRFQIVAALPTLEHQISGGGAYLSGGSVALRLTTAQEPVPSGVRAFRKISPQLGTIWFSFLLRPVSIGTGSDSFEVQIRSGNNVYGRAAIRPSQSGTDMVVWSLSESGGNGSGGLKVGTTYLVVFGLERVGGAAINLKHGINPSFSSPPWTSASFTMPSDAAVTEIGFSVISTDISGPSTTIDIDEFRVGYRYSDVVPEKAVTSLVPSVQLSAAKRLRWQSETGRRYRVQFAYDLNATWFNHGNVIQGDNTMKTVFDTSDESNHKFWRVVIDP
jgi:hypothetical protein